MDSAKSINNNMKAIILAGGLGTRIRAVAPGIPKSMIPVNGRPFLEYEIEYLKEKGIKEIVLCVSYLRDCVIDHFGDGRRFGVKIEYAVEKNPLGTGGAIKNAVDNLDIPDYFVALNGDTFIEWDLAEMQKLFSKTNAEIVMVLARTTRSDTSLVKVNKRGKIVKYTEKPDSLPAEKNNLRYTAAGIYILRKALISGWPEGRFSLEYNCIPEIVDRGSAYGIMTGSNIYDIGTPDRLRVFSEFLKARDK